MSPVSLIHNKPSTEPSYLAQPLASHGPSFTFTFSASASSDASRQRSSGTRGTMMHAPLPACSGRTFTGPPPPSTS